MLVLAEVKATTISLYFADFECSNAGNILKICTDIPQGVCCKDTQGQDNIYSALFQGLPTLAIGSIFRPNAQHRPCGNECNSGHGLSLCLRCRHPNSNHVLLSGALWHKLGESGDSSDVEKRAENCTASVVPDAIEGSRKRFRINYDVPQTTTEEITQMIKDNAHLKDDDIPEHLRAYEVHL